MNDLNDLNPKTRRPYPPDHPNGLTTLPDFGTYAGPIRQAVDDYLLMERKARAWDELRAFLDARAGDRYIDEVLAEMNRLVHPAQNDV